MTVARPFVRAVLRSPPNSSKGAALLVILFLVLATFSTIIVSQLSKAGLETLRQKKTLEALAQAKQALISWSVVRGDVSAGRPGTLPCPDRYNLGTDSGSCSATGGTSIGRLPWKTLGIEDLRDADGERLWYAVSDNFRVANSAAINSDSPGTLELYASDGTTLLTQTGERLAAVVFSVGAPLPGQDRGSSPNAATNYLDAANTRNNAIASGPFIAGPVKNAQGDIMLNDLVLGISARELISAVEKRVLKEAQNALAAFVIANGKYPNPAKPNDPGCISPINNIGDPPTCAVDNTVCFGRFPDIPEPSTWFRPNGWGRVMAYALNDISAGCTTALKIDVSSKSYVLIAPGITLAGQTRPSSSLADYLEDPANKDAWSADPNFSMPSSISNDQLRSYP